MIRWLERQITVRRMWLILGAAAALWFAFTAGMTVLRYRLNYSPAYDFGIFSQMYYYLDKCLQPLTTVERDGLLSHFAVHLSPIFYALLPFYKLVPRPETLLVLQALLVAGGVIPLVLLARALKYSPLQTLCFGLVYCAYPAFLGGCFYDFHENKFLTVIILWVMYFMETRRFKSMLACLALLLMVKEDAPVYAACIGLYLFLWKKEYRLGGLVFMVSCLYFAMAVWYINRFGDGAMVNRFDNYISNRQLGLMSMFKTILVNPAYVLSQIAVTDKIIFFLEMLLPLGFLPLLTKDWQKWTLLIPFVLINLMSNYKYQHSILFQYTYGSGALLFYLAIVNFRSLAQSGSLPKWLRRHLPGPVLRVQLLTAGLACALVITGITAASKTRYARLYDRHHKKASQARELLEAIPEGDSVKASTFFVPQLSMRDEIYLLNSEHPARWAVVDLRRGYEKNLDKRFCQLRRDGFKETGRVEGYVAVFAADDA